jgi:iron complex outermembrane recepter protein
MERVHPKSACTVAAFLMLILFSFNGTRAFPGVQVVAGTAMDTTYATLAYGDTVTQFNHFGSFGSFNNGIRATIRTKTFDFLANYNYSNFNGYRAHSSQYSHNFDLDIATAPSANTGLRIIGHYFNGRSLMPGSLTREEFDRDPFQADPRAVNRNEFRATRRGQVEIKYTAGFGRSLDHKIEISGFGQIEYFDRTTKEFKITTKYVLGLTARYAYHSRFWNRDNEFSAGGNLFTQPERKEEYENFSGQRSDRLEQIEVEKTISSGCWLSDNFELIREKLFLHLTGKYNHVIYSVAEETLPARSDKRTYNAFTPDIVLNYKIAPFITLFTSLEAGFKNPVVKELESPEPSHLFNQDLKAQTSTTLNFGIKGTLAKSESAIFFKSLQFETVLSGSNIDNEIVRYEIFGDEYYRNASETNRYRFSLHTSLEIVRNLIFSAGYTYSHFIYKSYTANSIETDSTGNIVFLYRDFSGNAEPNVPCNNLDLSLSYKHPIGEKADVYAKMNYRKLSGFWVDDANSDQTHSCDLLNSVVGFDIRLGHFACSVSAGVNNILDQVYVGNANINSMDKRFYNAGSPRDIFGSVSFNYMF